MSDSLWRAALESQRALLAAEIGPKGGAKKRAARKHRRKGIRVIKL